MRQYNPARDIVGHTPHIGRQGRDTFSSQGASELAAEIDAWWHSRGFPQVKHHVEYAMGKNGGNPFWVVRGNLIGGLPPKVAQMKEAA